MNSQRTMKTSYLIKRFLPYFSKYRFILLFDLFCAALTTVCELALPMIVRTITQYATTDISKLTIEFILKVGLLYVVLRLIDILANYYMQSTGHIMGSKIETDMRTDIFAHLQKLSFSYFDNTKIGQIMSRITNDLFDVTEFAHHCPEEFFIAAIKIVGSFIILSSINVPLTLIIFSILPIMLFFVRFFNKRLRANSKESRQHIGNLNAQIEDSLLGVRVVKSFANESLEEEKFSQGNLEFLDIKERMYKYMAGFNSVTRVFDGIMYITVVIVGALFLRNGQIQAADYVAYLLYISTLLTSIRRIVDYTEQFQKGMTGIERFIEVMDATVDIFDKEDAITLEQVEGKVEFRDVSFHYDEDSENVLSHLNISVKPGENIALVGPSGGGKTTFCNLIQRFYDVSEGAILLDNIDIRDIKLNSLRNNIGVVQQDVYLFSGTVFENIEYGKPGATLDEVIYAAKLAGAHDFISQLEKGYDTYVGERGFKLSGGQKQRISIARVFLKNPPVLILDEATSALDNENEKIVQESLEKLAKDRTTFTIAHRLTTIRNADTILVLTENGIEEQGTHKQLMRKKGMYHQLYQLYTETMDE